MRLYNKNGHTQFQDSGIGKNSLALTGLYFVTKTGSVVDKAVAGGLISGVNSTIRTFAANNETVAKAKVTFNPDSINALYEVAITGGTITIDDEGKFYDLTDSETVNGASESTTTGQVQMVKFLTATNSVFKIVNA